MEMGSMKRALGFLFGLWMSAMGLQAEATIWWVTRAEPVAAGLRCTVVAEERPEGKIRFVVVVSPETTAIGSRPSMSLSYARMQPEGGTLGPLRPLLPYEWELGSVVCEFEVNMETVAEPGFCFAFCRPEEVSEGGVVRRTGKVDFLCARLSDFVGPEPTPVPRVEPPDDAPAGRKVQGVALGLWMESVRVPADELVRFMIFARRDADSPLSIGVGASLFRDSAVVVMRGEKEILRVPVGGAVDGPEDVEYFVGGFGLAQKLPPGDYRLIWKAGKRESNPLDITVE